jgi:hypothetical protein
MTWERLGIRNPIHGIELSPSLSVSLTKYLGPAQPNGKNKGNLRKSHLPYQEKYSSVCTYDISRDFHQSHSIARPPAWPSRESGFFVKRRVQVQAQQ